MNKRMLGNILILFLVSSSVFLVFRYASSLKEDAAALENQKQNLLQEMEKEKLALEKEKASLRQLVTRNEGLKNYLKSARSRLNKSFAVLGRAEEQFEKLKVQFSILKAENGALLGERARLTDENKAMRTKLETADKLKQATVEIKRPVQKEGNQGFLIKDGQLDSVAKVKIGVNLTPANNYERSIPAVISK